MKKLVSLDGRKAVLHRSRMNPSLRRNFEALDPLELIAKLKSLTNLRAVRSADSATGWTIEAGPIPGWEEVPTW